MSLLTALVLKEHATEVKKKLLSLGLVDFTELEALAGDYVTRSARDESLSSVEALLPQIESLYRQIETPLPQPDQKDIDAESPLDLEGAEKLLERLHRLLNSIRDRQKQVNALLTRNRELLGYLEWQRSGIP